jgi:protein-tyrosine-phosphatase
VVTLGDASTERFPVWPFSRNVRNWSLADPERVSGSIEQKREAFRRVRDQIRLNVREFLTQSFPQLQATEGRAFAAGSARN